MFFMSNLVGMKMSLGLVSLMLSVGGCATITKGTTDTVQVEVSNCGEQIECTVSNKKGSWDFKAPGSVTFKKSDDPLNLTCIGRR